MTLAKDDRPSDAKTRRLDLARPATGSAEQRQLADATGDLRKNLIALQRLAGNHAVTGLLAGFPPTVLRLTLYDGPPLAPGNYKYGNVILGLDPNAMRKVLTDRAGSAGLVAERKWKADFVADMQATPTAQVHKYEDPSAKQTISVEPTLATNADRSQREIEDSTSAAQRQFQQDLLALVGSMLDASEGKLKAEAKRYGFPDHDSIFNPQLPSAGQAAVAGSLPASEEIRAAIRAAKVLLDGKRKLKSVREANAKLGPFLGEMTKPATLEPATEEYYDLRQRSLSEFPILASFERSEEKLTEFAAGAQFAQPGSTGHGATTAILNAQDKIRLDIADKLSNIAVVRAGMKEQDKIDKFWANPTLISSTKRKMALDPKGLPNAAADDKIREMTEDKEFSAKIKTAVGITGEHVSVQGGHSFVEAEWMNRPEHQANGRQRPWILVKHYHPNRGLTIDRIPSTADFQHVVTRHLAGQTPRAPVQSTIVWTDPVSNIRFETQFGYTPRAARPFWTRYRVEDGTFRVASFAEDPWGAGATEYNAWSRTAFHEPGAGRRSPRREHHAGLRAAATPAPTRAPDAGSAATRAGRPGQHPAAATEAAPIVALAIKPDRRPAYAECQRRPQRPPHTEPRRRTRRWCTPRWCPG